MNESRIPQCRVCLNFYCGKNCIYCRAGGEGYFPKDRREMSCPEIYELSRIMALNGVTVMRLTGGEPMNRPDIVDIVRCIKNIPGIRSVQMVTRSHRFGNKAQTLKGAGLDSVTFSLDAMDEVLFSKISGVGIGFHKAYIKSIHQAAQSGIPVRINVVVMKGINEGEIEKILNFAGELQCDVKLLDLMKIGDEEFWHRHYLPFDELIEMLEERAVEVSTVTAPGGLGTPMPQFLMPNGVAVYVKYACIGTWYGDVCRLCPMYPCQDAIMAVRITADGKLKRCLMRDDNLVDLLSMVKNGMSETQVNAAIKQVLSTFMNAQYQAGAWTPDLYIKNRDSEIITYREWGVLPNDFITLTTGVATLQKPAL